MLKTALLLLLTASICPAEVALTPSSSLLIDPGEPGPVQKAAHDLARDLEAVFGKPVRVVHSPAEASPVTIAIAFERNLPRTVERPSGWETFDVKLVASPWPGSPVRHALVLTGSDVRGTIYAIYHVSRQLLHVDPFYWWTDNPPARRDRVVIPASFGGRQGPPTFRYRGWFLNDEDLLTAWRPGRSGETGIALDVWERVFEAILRLNGDMVVAGTFLFPDEPQMKAATARGLILSQHHMEPLGLNVYRWPEGKPFTLDLLTEAWRCAVRQFDPQAEVIWTVGLRGRYDNPFWMDATGGKPTPEAQGRVIRAAIERQMALVRENRQETAPDFIMNTWMEGTRLVRSGALKIPEGVHLVWADDGAGNIMDGGNIGKDNGVYYHTAVIGGNASTYTERVPVARIRSELSRAARAGGTHYLLLNTSDILPVSMTTRAVMEAGWNIRPWQAEKYDATYLAAWSRQQFGPRAGPLVARYYDAYFAAPSRYATRDKLEMGDYLYQQIGRDLLLRILRGPRTSGKVVEGDASTEQQLKRLGIPYEQYLSGLERGCAEAEGRWARAAQIAAQAAPLVPVNRRAFFDGHILAQLSVQRNSNLFLGAVAAAAEPGIANQQRLDRLAGAIRHNEAVLAALNEAGYGRWQGFFTRGDWFVNVPVTLALARIAVKHLEGQPLTAEDQKTATLADSFITENSSKWYTRIKAYQGSRRVEFCRP